VDWHNALENQVQLAKWLGSFLGKKTLMEWVEREVYGEPLKHGIYKQVIPLLPSTLMLSTPIFVAAEMCELVNHAREGFEPEPMLKEDFIVPWGFVYFEEPLYVLDRNQKPVSMGAFSWGPVGHSLDDEGYGEGVVITFFSSAWAVKDGFHEFHLKAMADFGAPELQIVHIAPVLFGIDPELESTDENGNPTGAKEWWQTIQTCLRLMQQHISERKAERPPRAARRRAESAGKKETDVMVIRLRRAHVEHATGETKEIPWSHQWIVNGHWRNHYYPKLKTHRQIWIHPYVKGPEDRPLVYKRRAYQWDR
jgi:hypothetical protein